MPSHLHERLRAGAGTGGPALRWLPFAIAGTVSILAGGFVAAAGGEAPSKHLSWACAYLVLVCGCAQVFLSGGRALLAGRSPSPRLAAWQFSTFNLGNACVLAGTLGGAPPALYAGSTLLIVAFALFAWDTAGTRTRHGPPLALYRLAIAALAISVPVGSILGR